ncbi:hypothetical protein K449DRAFT_432904 [Hypoxylon sp. EC38]|nr:hypothetical protein K449DRAFT_432904 [Hypoxylon sp. EC38]
MQQDVSLQLSVRPLLPIPSDGKADDLQHAFGYVCDISKRDWTFRPCGDSSSRNTIRNRIPIHPIYSIVHLLTHVGLLHILFGYIYVYFTHMGILTASRTLGPISATGNVPSVLYMISIADPGPMAGAANKKDATKTIARKGLMAVTSLGKNTSNATWLDDEFLTSPISCFFLESVRRLLPRKLIGQHMHRIRVSKSPFWRMRNNNLQSYLDIPSQYYATYLSRMHQAVNNASVWATLGASGERYQEISG